MFAKAAMQFQAFLLRRNWLGPMGDFVMVITTTGRKSGQAFSTPIGYLRDGQTFIGLSVGGRANWYKNLVQTPTVELNVKGRAFRATATPVRDPAERRQIFEKYKAAFPDRLPRLFGLPAGATPEMIEQAFATREFVRFQPLSAGQ